MIVTYGHVSRDPYGMLCILADNLALLLKSIIYFMNTRSRFYESSQAMPTYRSYFD